VPRRWQILADAARKGPLSPIEVDSGPAKPQLPGTVILRETLDELIDAIAVDLLFQAKGCVRAFGDFHLALSGDPVAEPLYLRLMYDPNFRDFPWKKTHLWVVEERRVPFDDDRSRFKCISEIIVDHSGIPREQVHPIFAMAEEPDADYQRRIQECLEWREKGQDRLDYLLLVLGPDGSAAGLAPLSPALDEEDRLAAVNTGPTVPPPGLVTMTRRLINGSRFIAVLAAGPDAREPIARVQARDSSEAELPITGIHPLAGEMRWYLDWPACPEQKSP
jgi:6-phosphogluconolactonase